MNTVQWDFINAFAEPIGKSKGHYIDPEDDNKTLCGVEIPHDGAYADVALFVDCKRCRKKYDKL